MEEGSICNQFFFKHYQHKMCSAIFSDIFDSIIFYNWEGPALITYAPRGRGWGQASYTFPLRITCRKG